MTTNEALALGRRMMTCEGFEWRPGMAAIRADGEGPRHGRRIVVGREVEGRLLISAAGLVAELPASQYVPDPRDPGTVGHALAMMREVTGWRGVSIVLEARTGRWRMQPQVWQGAASTEVEAIVAAWEALS